MRRPERGIRVPDPWGSLLKLTTRGVVLCKVTLQTFLDISHSWHNALSSVLGFE